MQKSNIISIINLIKGGAGKSTLAINLTAALERNNKKVCLIDLDEEQKAAYKWSKNRVNTRCLLAPSTKQISDIIKEYDYTLFDTGGFDTVSTQALISVSDIILIPTSMSPIETEAFGELIRKLQKIKKILKKEELNVYIVPSRIHTSVSSTKVAKHFDPLNSLGYKITAPIYNRVAYQNSYFNGSDVFKTKDIKAQTEIFTLYESIS